MPAQIICQVLKLCLSWSCVSSEFNVAQITAFESIPLPEMYNVYCKTQKNAKHKGKPSPEAVFVCHETHVDFHKTFASNFSAYTISILKILSETH